MIHVGILGGGQLSRMLYEAAVPFIESQKLTLQCLVDSPEDPLTYVSSNYVVGTNTDPQILTQFFQGKNLICFENEFVSVEIIRRVVAQNPAFQNIKFGPSLEAIAKTQDKLLQKKFFVETGLPTAPFFELNSENPLAEQFEKIFATFQWQSGAVLKWTRMGYDGKGVFFLRKQEHLKAAQQFVEQAWARGITVFMEECVDFRRELAVIGCHSYKGDVKNYPVVISQQRHGVCHWVQGPAEKLSVSSQICRSIERMVLDVAQKLPIYGSFGIEFFECMDGRILINEMAPRVHNSGHYTLDAVDRSQFANHWYALLGEKIEGVDARGLFTMLNLLGPEGIQVQFQRGQVAPIPLHDSSLQVYWYDKKEIRAGRKVGHVNIVAQDMKEYNELNEKLMEFEKNWVKSLQTLSEQARNGG